MENIDGNLEALKKYEKHIEDEEKAYEELLEALRETDDPDEWEYIIESMGWGDADTMQILWDI